MMKPNTPPSPKSPSSRDSSIDLLRGSAVFFMIATHVFTVFYDGTSPILDFWIWWGATICFSAFLFAFTMVYGMKLQKGTLPINKNIKRAVILLGGYYVIGIWTYIFWEKMFSISIIQKIIFFQTYPIFTEFIPTFAFFVITIVLLQNIIRKLIHSPSVLIISSVILYIIGMYLAEIEIGNSFLSTILPLIAGSTIHHSFGLFSYAPLAVIGLIWGYNPNNIREKNGHIFTFLAVIMLTMNQFTQFTPWERWPPTSLFILFGLSYSLIITTNSKIIRQLTSISTYLENIGKHAFSYYILHLFFILPISAFLVDKTNNMALPIVILLTTLIFIHLTQKYAIHKA